MFELNDEQRGAVEHDGGPLLVLAGAGTGKTTTLTARVGRLLERGVPAHRVLLLTFTRRAAAEMVGRAGSRPAVPALGWHVPLGRAPDRRRQRRRPRPARRLRGDRSGRRGRPARPRPGGAGAGPGRPPHAAQGPAARPLLPVGEHRPAAVGDPLRDRALGRRPGRAGRRT